MRIYLARHGETELNSRGLLQGRRDSPLTEVGLRQADQLGSWLASAPLRLEELVVWSSPLRRAVHTAERMLAQAGVSRPIKVDDRLVEVDGGSFEGVARANAAAQAPGVDPRDVLLLHAEDGEKYDSVRARLHDWLGEVKAQGGDHIVVSHAGCGRVLRALYQGLGREGLAAMDTHHTALFLLRGGEVERIDTDK